MEDNHRVILTDMEGNDVEFEFLDVVEVGGSEYVVLLPMDCAEKGEVVIFRIDDDDESYISLEDEEEAAMVFEAFKEKNRDEFRFGDDA